RHGRQATLYLAEVSLAGQTDPVVVKVLNSDVTTDEGQFAELSARWSEQAELLRFINRLGVVGVREHFEGAPEHPTGRAEEYTDRRSEEHTSELQSRIELVCRLLLEKNNIKY